jgi:hypothetical protein
VTQALGDGTAVVLKAYLDRGGEVFAGMSDSAQSTAVGSVIANAEAQVSRGQFGNLNVFQANVFAGNQPKFTVAQVADARSAGAQALAGELIGFEIIRKSFNEELTAYLSALSGGNQAAAQQAQDAVIYKLVKEMRDDAAVGGDNFKNNKAALRLTAFVNTTLSKAARTPERKALLNFFPALTKAAKAEGQRSRRNHILDVLKPLEKPYNQEVLGRRGD